MNIRENERGVMNILLIPLVVCGVLFVGAIIFGFWAFGQYQDYKTNTDQKISAAVATGNKATQATDAKTYAAAAQNPLKTYLGPEPFGSVILHYPKNWSVYMNMVGPSAPPNIYFQFDTVTSLSDPNATYNLRLRVVQQLSSDVMKQFLGLAKSGKVTVTPYTLPKVPSVIGSRIDGNITGNKQGSMIVMPLRNTTLEVWTESAAGVPDFNTVILPNLSFSP